MPEHVHSGQWPPTPGLGPPNLSHQCQDRPSPSPDTELAPQHSPSWSFPEAASCGSCGVHALLPTPLPQGMGSTHGSPAFGAQSDPSQTPVLPWPRLPIPLPLDCLCFPTCQTPTVSRWMPGSWLPGSQTPLDLDPFSYTGQAGQGLGPPILANLHTEGGSRLPTQSPTVRANTCSCGTSCSRVFTDQPLAW